MRLLFKGADITIKNVEGNTPFEYICKPYIKMISNIKKIIEYAVLVNEVSPGIIKASGIESRRELINLEIETKNYENKCFDEVKLMKEFVITGTGVTLLDICYSNRCINHRYINLLSNLNYDSFIIYKDFIALCVNEAINRAIYIDETMKLLDSIFLEDKNATNWNNLPYEIRYHIAEVVHTT